MYKETINDAPAQMLRAERTNSDSPWVVSQTWNLIHADNLRSSGESTPNFHLRRKRGELLPFTSWKQVRNKLESIDYGIHTRNISSGWEQRHYGTGNPTLSNGDLISWAGASVGQEKLNSDVIMQAAGARVVNSAWDVLTFAAEASQVVSMFRGLVTKVTNLLNAKPPGTPWGIWLELRYGWRTLAYDINDIEQAFSKIHNQKFSRASAGQSVNWTVATSSTSSIATHNSVIKSTTDYRLNGRGKVVIKGSLPRFQVNILKTAWEVTKLSFVVDWFINIGRLIDALQFSLTTEYQGGYGTFLEAEHIKWMEHTLNPGYMFVDQPKSRATKSASVTMRTPAGVPLIPLISVNIDTFKVFDLVSLLIQALRR